MGFRELSVLANISTYIEGDVRQLHGDRNSSTQDLPGPRPYAPRHLAAHLCPLSHHLISQYLRKNFPEFCELFWQIKGAQGGGCDTSDLQPGFAAGVRSGGRLVRLNPHCVRTGYTAGQLVVAKQHLVGDPMWAATSTVGSEAFQASVAPCKSKGQTQEERTRFPPTKGGNSGFFPRLKFKCLFLRSLP